MAVLAELGGKLRESLRKLGSVTSGAGGAGSLTASQLNTLLSDIARALIEADVNVKLVNELRANIRQKVMDLVVDDDDSDNNAVAGAATATAASNQEDARKARYKAANLSKIVQRAVVDELVALLTPKQQVIKDGDSTTSSGNTSNKTKKATTASGATAGYQMRKGKSNVILFVGLQGAGKTTTVAKFANYYQRRGWKTCMVCADTFRAGAFE
jgi:signal recognition particle subunit SRP54